MMVLHVFHHTPLKTFSFLFFFLNTPNKFLESWSCMGPKRSYPTRGRLHLPSCQKILCNLPLYPKFPKKSDPSCWITYSVPLMVFHTNLSIIYLFIPACNLHLLSKYHGLDVVLNNGNIPSSGISCSGGVYRVQLVQW